MIVFTEMFEVSIGDFYVVVKTIKIVILVPEVENPCPMPDYHVNTWPTVTLTTSLADRRLFNNSVDINCPVLFACVNTVLV